MQPLINLLLSNPLILLFVVSAVGYAIGRIKIAGSSLGVAAVLFAGLGFGALDPNLKIPDIVYQLGLVVFVYTIGIESGHQFFRTLRGNGLRFNIMLVVLILLAAGLTIAAASFLNLPATTAAGLFAGSLTNTPALAAVIEYLKADLVNPSEALLNEPVVAYSIAYPMGVIGMMIVIALAPRLFRINYQHEASSVSELAAATKPLVNRSIQIKNSAATQRPIAELVKGERWDVVFGRLRRDGQLSLISGQTLLLPGDIVSVIGHSEEVNRVVQTLGTYHEEQLELDRSELDYRRIFVSNPRLAGQKLRNLNLPQQYGALVSRVRRGDIEMLAHGDLILEPGDRVRVVAPRENMDAVSKFFGDSYRALSEIDILTFNLGMALGLLLGLITVPLPGGVEVRLGIAGGPLVVALILGALDRTGPLVWSLPYSANLMLRQVGLVLFLAGVGTRSGFAFFSTISQGAGILIFAAGAAITVSVGLLTLWVAHKLLKAPLNLVVGMVAALQTNPAILSYALQQTRNELPNSGYITIYAAALIVKVIVAQLILVLLL